MGKGKTPAQIRKNYTRKASTSLQGPSYEPLIMPYVPEHPPLGQFKGGSEPHVDNFF